MEETKTFEFSLTVVEKDILVEQETEASFTVSTIDDLSTESESANTEYESFMEIYKEQVQERTKSSVQIEVKDIQMNPIGKLTLIFNRPIVQIPLKTSGRNLQD